jgi:methyl-accepting chemotaxis protein
VSTDTAGTVVTTPSAGVRRSFADLSVKVKIPAGISVAVIVGVVGLNALSAASASAETIYHSNVASIKAIGQIETTTRQARLNASKQAISQDAATVKKYADAFIADLAAFDAAVAAYQASMPTGDPAMVADLQTRWRAWADLVETKFLPLGEANDMTFAGLA